MADCFSAPDKASGGGVIARAFKENTSFCGCLPLTEYDEKGNHRWRISVTIQNGSCCKADYTCSKGDEDLLFTRFCLPHKDWNNTVPECSIAVTSEDVTASTTFNHVAIPGILLGGLIVCMLLFVAWWRRRAVSKGRTEDERNSTEGEDTDTVRGNDIYNLVLEDIEITTADFYKNRTNSSVSNESSLPKQYGHKVYCYSNGFNESNPYIERDSRPYSNSCSTKTSVAGSVSRPYSNSCSITETSVSGSDSRPYSNSCSIKTSVSGSDSRPYSNSCSTKTSVAGSDSRPYSNSRSTKTSVSGSDSRPYSNSCSTKTIVSGSDSRPYSNSCSIKTSVSGSDSRPYSNSCSTKTSVSGSDSRPYSNSCSTKTSVSGSDNQLESRNETGSHVTFETKL